jgi:hypothetical protein
VFGVARLKQSGQGLATQGGIVRPPIEQSRNQSTPSWLGRVLHHIKLKAFPRSCDPSRTSRSQTSTFRAFGCQTRVRIWLATSGIISTCERRFPKDLLAFSVRATASAVASIAVANTRLNAGPRFCTAVRNRKTPNSKIDSKVLRRTGVSAVRRRDLQTLLIWHTILALLEISA